MRWSFLAILLTPLAGAAEKPDFARDVQPILSEYCYACHGPDAKARKADLRLDTADGALRKMDPVIVPGMSADSEIIKRIASTDDEEAMPPKSFNKKVSAQQLATLKAWIDGGAAWGKHWAFAKPERPATGKSIDEFIRTRLEKEGLKPSPEASRETLLRRVTLDLTGLPPTTTEREAFLKDTSPEAYSKLVDRLLKSPRFGERMVWEWLEAARYADSNGYQGDGERTMYPWRDWAVRAFNSNMPFDRFTVEQIAGDLLPNATPEQKLATGFLRNHAINGEGGRIPEENRVDYVMDMAETVGTVWLGLTFNCCRCHDHKFDPIAQKEYYGLFAFFNQTPVNGGGGDPFTAPTITWPTPEQKKAFETAEALAGKLAGGVAEVEKKLADKFKDAPKEIADALKVAPEKRTKSQIDALEKKFGSEKDYAKQLADLGKAVESRESARRSIPRVMVMEDMPKPRDSFIYDKGLYNKPGAKVTAIVPADLPPLKAEKVDRLALAKWLVSEEHPLTARVTVNRLWQQFFGIGLVKTAGDFGSQGERPSHPELLDWLAVEFVESGWDVKRLVKLMVTSATYRQSSNVSKELRERDPENRLLARAPRHRLPSWMIRDQALAASGLLVDKRGGPPVKPYQPGGVWEEATFGGKQYTPDTGEGLYRRSVYTFWRRIVGPTMFFDVSPRQVCSVKSSRTNTPLHALLTLNDIQFVEAGRALAEKVLKESKGDAERIESAFCAIMVRAPKPAEATVLKGALERLRGQYKKQPQAAKDLLAIGASKPDAKLDASELAAWAALCNLMFNLDEALSKE